MTTALPLRPASGDTSLLRQVFGSFPTGIIAVCARADDGPVGMAASSFTSVSMDPPLVSVCVQNTSTTWPRLRAATRLGLSVLADGQDHACRTLSAKDGDRFDNLPWSDTDHGAVFVDDAAAVFDCTLHDELPAGDHLIALLHVHAALVHDGALPLVFHASRFRRLLAT